MAAEVSAPVWLVWLVWLPRLGRQTVSGLGAVVLGGGIAHLLEGVAAVAEVPDRQSLAKLAIVADDGG